MASHEQDDHWTEKLQNARSTDSTSPSSQRSSNGTAVQEPSRRPPADGLEPHNLFPSNQHVFPHKHASLPASTPDGTRHTDTRTLTDPNPQDRNSLFPPAVLAEQARLSSSPPNNTTRPLKVLPTQLSAPLALVQPSPLDSAPSFVASPSDHLQNLWDIDQVEPGTILFSTGPVMTKPPLSNTDPTRSSVDRSPWTAPSGVPSNLPPDSASSQERDATTAPQTGYPPDSPSLVYTTGHPANTGPHTGYGVGYPPYNPGNPAFGPTSPRHPSFGGPPSSGTHAQGNTYSNPGPGHAYTSYRPGMPYGAYPTYQAGSAYSQYPGSPPMGAGFGPMSGGFPGASPAAGGYPNSPSASNYQGSPVAAGYSSPTSAYGMHFAPYGMVSAPPMYAPATYAPAPYGHPYLPSGPADESPPSGMWWFMPAGSSAGSSNAQSGQAYGAQPQGQAQYVPRFGGSQQPPPSQPMPAMLNTNSSSTQQLPNHGGFPPQVVAHSPTMALSPMTTGSMPSVASPHQMYAAFGSMGLQSPQPPAVRPPPPLVLSANVQQPPSQPSAPLSPLSPVVQSPVRPTSTSKGRASAAGKAGPGGSRVTSPATRRPWHPNPPVARSDWVMWVGNVPNDATHDELWTFFNQDTTAPEPVVPAGPGRTLLPPVPADKGETGSSAEHSHGVSSVFLISRSNCAFVNYEEEVYLTRAVSFFNGRPLRPHDPRCPRLVCRVRRKDDDLRAGVGGQRGTGLHARWIQEQERRIGDGVDGVSKDKDTGVEDPATSPSTYLGAASSSGSSPPIHAPVDDAHKLPPDLTGRPHGNPREAAAAHHSASGSTNSSFLARNFPKRYFILKSLTQFDLNISVERGLWATQAHNESTLDRAYRTSKDVFLIFSANKSGEWFGYARMEGPIIGSQQSVSWESRGPPKSPTSPTVQRKSEAAETSTEAGSSGSKLLFSPSEHKFAASPVPITPGGSFPLVTRTEGQTSAPPELGNAHKQLTNPDQSHTPRGSTGAVAALVRAGDAFELDKSAPYRAARDASSLGPSKEQESLSIDGVVHRDTALTTEDLERARGLSEDASVRPIRETLATPGEEDRTESWGKPFKIRWIKTERLPFHRTRHLRNPWNSDREVKVSRDGTEVEPSVGQQLLDEWDKLAEPESPTAAPSMSRAHLPSRPGMQSYGSTPPKGPAGRAR